MLALHDLSRRWFNLGGFAVCAMLLGYAYYSQFHDGLEPCPLCIFERVGVIAVGLSFLLAGLHNPGRIGSRIYGVLVALTALAGAMVAGRHIWIQSLPADQVPTCGPGLNYMLQAFPLGSTLKMVFTGSGECAVVNWRLFGLSMPVWVLFCFIGLGVLGLYRNWRRD